jgi:hypothetical protein
MVLSLSVIEVPLVELLVYISFQIIIGFVVCSRLLSNTYHYVYRALNFSHLSFLPLEQEWKLFYSMEHEVFKCVIC